MHRAIQFIHLTRRVIMSRFLPFICLVTFASVALAQESDTPPIDAKDPASVIAATHLYYDEGNAEAFLELMADSFDINHTMARRFVSEHESAQLSDFVKNAAAGGRTVEVLEQMTYGPFVIEKQRITEGGDPSEHLWIYEVEDGKVVHLWHFDAAAVLSDRENEE